MVSRPGFARSFILLFLLFYFYKPIWIQEKFTANCCNVLRLEDIFSVLSFVVSWRTVEGYASSVSINLSISESESLTVFPNNLSKVSSFHGESWLVVVIILNFIVPHFYGYFSKLLVTPVAIATSQVLSNSIRILAGMVDCALIGVVAGAFNCAVIEL